MPSQIEDKIQYLATKEDIAKVRGEFKEDIARLETKLIGLIFNSRLKMEESLKGQTRWMVGILIAIFMAMLALYFKK